MAGRRRRNEEHENLERWLLTYADMITLLMAFFIMLYGMSQLDIQKFQAMAGSVRAELGSTGVLPGGAGVSRGGASPLRQTGVGFAPRPAPAAADLRHSVEKAIADVPQRGAIEVLSRDGAVVVRIPARAVNFPAGSADLTPEMERVLARLGQVAKRQNCAVRAEGHTCDLPVHTAQHASNWELSADRARNMALYMVKRAGLAPDRVACMGYADTRPVVPNTCEANRRRNRRVEFRLQPAPVTAAAPAATVKDDEGSRAPRPRVDIRPPRVNLLPNLKTKEEAL